MKNHKDEEHKESMYIDEDHVSIKRNENFYTPNSEDLLYLKGTPEWKDAELQLKLWDWSAEKIQNYKLNVQDEANNLEFQDDEPI